MNDRGRALPPHFREKSPSTDTAGTPWAGRDYSESPFPGDDGSAPEVLEDARRRHREGGDPDRVALVAALAGARVLVPIMAVAGEETTTAHGVRGDAGADMAMVSLTGPDGERTLPLFSSVADLAAWRPDTRPVPVLAAQAAQAAVQEGCTSLLLDAARGPATGGPVLLQRSILWALAQGRDWTPPHRDEELAEELARIAAQVRAVRALRAAPGTSREVDLEVHLVPGLDRASVSRVVEELSARLGESPLVAERITSLALRLRG